MSKFDELINRLRALETEASNPNTTEIDTLSAEQIATLINNEDNSVPAVLKVAIPVIARTAEQFAATIRSNHRVFYIGAGTSGRLGVLDAADCPPTFGTDPEQIIGLISGGYETLVLSAEGVEDDRQAAIDDLNRHRFSKDDLLIGLAASTRTPYTLSGLEYARSLGAKTGYIVCNQASDLPLAPDFLIELPVGPEVITGSTRMKSGTAQKLALNMISTTAMVLLGKTYGNLMVDLQARSNKLAARSRKILIDLFEIDSDEADRMLAHSEGSVKLAIVMRLLNCDLGVARERLAEAHGIIKNLPSN